MFNVLRSFYTEFRNGHTDMHSPQRTQLPLSPALLSSFVVRSLNETRSDWGEAMSEDSFSLHLPDARDVEHFLKNTCLPFEFLLLRAVCSSHWLVC